MSTNNGIHAKIPAGDLQLFDNYIPPLKGGNYFIQVGASLKQGSNPLWDNSAKLASQELIVSAPQFTMDTAQIINRYPPQNSVGLYGEVLPHIVLKDPMLAWEREMGGSKKTPWLALMVFQNMELEAGDGNATKTTSTTVADFLAPTKSILKGLTLKDKEDDVNPASSCKYIKLTTELFQKLVPRMNELPFLSHVRKINTGGRSLDGVNEDGIYSVTMSNRFATAPTVAIPKPIKNIVHLVSLEGLETYLAADADFTGFTDVALLSLASWTFSSLPDISEDFADLTTNLALETGATIPEMDPTKLWLRLPPITAAADPNTKEAAKRISDGYSPLAYHTRSGEDTFAWYRGPLTPILPKVQKKTSPYFTADAAMIYDKNFGVFDVSLASAWELGREAALSDSYFGQRLIDFRNKTNQLLEELIYKLQSDHFTSVQIDKLEATTTIQEEFLAMLTPELIKDIGATADSSEVKKIKDTTGPPTDPIQDAKDFLQNPVVQKQITKLIATDLASVAEWLAHLMLLNPVPFDNLVPDERMLPVESLRFFYMDPNWLDAAIDGALSLGIDSSKQTFFSEVTKGLIYDAAMDALAVIRYKKEGIDVPPNPTPPAMMSGFVLRSKLVTGWPNLVIRAKDKTDTTLNILRLVHLSPSVLFCIFDGVPDNVELSEPQESLGFGVDDDGKISIRNLLPSDPISKVPIGTQLELFTIRDLTGEKQLGMRAPDSLVINIDPTDNAGLYAMVLNELNTKGSKPPGNELGPSTFALQMVKSAECMVFNSQTS